LAGLRHEKRRRHHGAGAAAQLKLAPADIAALDTISA
jgi:hypothetical protein